MRSIAGRLRFQPSRPAPSSPHQVPNEHAENAGTRKRRNPEGASALDPLENAANQWLTAISTKPPCTQLTPSSAERARRERRHPKASTAEKSLALDPLENGIDGKRTLRIELDVAIGRISVVLSATLVSALLVQKRT